MQVTSSALQETRLTRVVYSFFDNALRFLFERLGEREEVNTAFTFFAPLLNGTKKLVIWNKVPTLWGSEGRKGLSFVVAETTSQVAIYSFSIRFSSCICCIVS